MKTKKTKLPADDPDPLDDLLGYHVRRLAVVTMADLAESLAPLRLKPAEASILFVIASHPGTTQGNVGKTLGILRANMAPLIAALSQRGLIKRTRVDGRSQALRLSAAGHALCRQARSAAESHEERVFGTLSRAQRARIIAELRALWRTKRGR